MSPWLDDPDFQPLGRQLAFAHKAVHAVLDRRLAEHGASLWNWVLLREASFADGASQRELSERVGVEPPSLVRQLDRFVEDGFVERRRDPDDRRVTRITVTDAGRRRLDELHAVAREMEIEIRSLLSERELAVVGKALTKIREHFSPDARHEVERAERGEEEVADAGRR